jgi:hypothetical protein
MRWMSLSMVLNESYFLECKGSYLHIQEDHGLQSSLIGFQIGHLVSTVS